MNTKKSHNNNEYGAFRSLLKIVLQTEARAILDGICQNDKEEFFRLIDFLLTRKGRLILAGVGKSGFVARKIASTMNSLGVRSLFVHPTDGAHGDFGSIDVEKDIVIAISQGGESDELFSLIYFCQKFNIPIVAITGNSQSTLGRAASFVIDSSVRKEACPMNLAPTASTTLVMAIGDAIAIILSQMGGFTKKDFAVSHPAGKLGRQLILTVSQVMHSDDSLALMHPDDKLADAIVQMTKSSVKGIVGIVDNKNALVGVLTDGDIRRFFLHNKTIDSVQLVEIMSHDPKYVHADDLVYDAKTKLMEWKIETCFVKDGENIVGVLCLRDVIKLV